MAQSMRIRKSFQRVSRRNDIKIAPNNVTFPLCWPSFMILRTLFPGVKLKKLLATFLRSKTPVYCILRRLSITAQPVKYLASYSCE